jgi:hypothetical protein
MLINFRQGIIRARSVSNIPDFLTWNNTFGTVDINITEPYLLACASFKGKEYLLEERADKAMAWGPFSWQPHWGVQPGVTCYYLYWDINLGSGNITRGYTPWAPYASVTAPPAQRINQHWYNTDTHVTYVWDGAAWLETCRVFAGSFSSSAYINEMPFGSQAGVHTSIDAGFIMYGPDNNAIREHDGTFFTSTTDARINTGVFSSPVKGETASTTLLAQEPIPAFYAITNIAEGKAGLADPNNPARYPIGVSTTQATVGEVVDYCYEGFIYNDQWNWNFTLGKDIFVSSNGLLVQGQPTNGLSGGFKVGTIINATCIQVAIDLYMGTQGAIQPAKLEHDITLVGTAVGGAPDGFTFTQGTTFTQFVDIISKKAIPPAYLTPTLALIPSPPPSQLEVGTSLSLSFTGTFVQGDGGAPTGTTIYKNSVNVATAFPYADVIVLDEVGFSYAASVSYAAGVVKPNNLGVPTGTLIPAGIASSQTYTYIGSRQVFYGTPSATPIASADVRALTGAFAASANTTVDGTGLPIANITVPNFIIAIPAGATRVVFAYPASLRDVASIRYLELADSEVKANFTMTTVSVTGANGVAAINYKVWTYTPVEPFSVANHYKVFI